MRTNQFPTGWDEQRVRDLIDYYENQTDEEAVAEYEVALSAPNQTLMVVPTELVPHVRDLIARHRQEREDFLQLPLEERRQRLAAQSEQIAEYYEQRSERVEREVWQGGDVAEP